MGSFVQIRWIVPISVSFTDTVKQELSISNGKKEEELNGNKYSRPEPAPGRQMGFNGSFMQSYRMHIFIEYSSMQQLMDSCMDENAGLP